MKIRNRQLVGWCLFDVANSSYTTLIITVAYGVIFTKLIVGPGADGSFSHANALWSLVLSVSWALVAFSGPVLGTLTDARAVRKKFLAASVLLCSACSALLYFCRSGDVVLACLLVIGSNIGFALSENFIAAFLPHIADKQDTGKISGLGWGMGYFGGLLSVILAQRVTGLDYSPENWNRLVWIGPLVGVFFLVASLPALLWLKEPPKENSRESGAFLEELARSVKESPGLGWVLLSCFFFQGGIAIVISFTAMYAEQEIHFTGAQQAMLFISLQVSAGLGAFVFGWLQSRWNSLRVLDATLYLWLVALLGIYLIRPVFGVENPTAVAAFFFCANLAGLGLGATQSCGRVLVAFASTEAGSGTSFGLWGMAVKVAQVLSLLLFGLAQTLFPIRQAMLLCAVFFAVPLLIHRCIDSKTFSVS